MANYTPHARARAYKRHVNIGLSLLEHTARRHSIRAHKYPCSHALVDAHARAARRHGHWTHARGARTQTRSGALTMA